MEMPMDLGIEDHPLRIRLPENSIIAGCKFAGIRLFYCLIKPEWLKYACQPMKALKLSPIAFFAARTGLSGRTTMKPPDSRATGFSIAPRLA
ncbi:hypothetical protein JW906_00695 [bacterium]|nr:hypothetical protein [bacterium]